MPYSWHTRACCLMIFSGCSMVCAFLLTHTLFLLQHWTHICKQRALIHARTHTHIHTHASALHVNRPQNARSQVCTADNTRSPAGHVHSNTHASTCVRTHKQAEVQAEALHVCMCTCARAHPLCLHAFVCRSTGSAHLRASWIAGCGVWRPALQAMTAPCSRRWCARPQCMTSNKQTCSGRRCVAKSTGQG